MSVMKIQSMGSVQTKINGNTVEKKNFIFNSKGKKGHLITTDNGKGQYYKINNIHKIFENRMNDDILLKRLNKTLKKSKKSRRRKGRRRKQLIRTKKKKKKKKIFKFY